MCVSVCVCVCVCMYMRVVYVNVPFAALTKSHILCDGVSCVDKLKHIRVFPFK